MCWLWLCMVILSLGAKPTQAVVGGNPAAPPEPDAAVVFTQRHGFSARLEGLKDDRRGYYTFAGIRYAEPPIGPRRFQRPLRRYLAGEINATRYCPPCPQVDPRGSNRVIGSEDCLCLNIFAPKMPGTEEGCPVVFFIHGGNYKTGSAQPYGGQHFTQKDTILVTAQYRLGSLGFLSTGTKDASGNTGLFDLHSAMTWIKDYIEFFGGDSSRILVMGQGSGGSAASLMALSNEGRAATGVAALSGTPLSPGAIRSDPKQHAKAVAEGTGCPTEPSERMLLCLRKLPAEKIIMVDKEISSDSMIETQAFLNEISGRSGTGARIEGAYDNRGLPPMVAEAPSESLQLKQQRSPMLTGVTSAETSNAVFGKYAKFLTEQLTAVKDFIKKDLIGGLKGVVKGVEGLNPLKIAGIQQVIPLPDYYQALFDSTFNAIDGLSQIVDATGDALFNFPAYQSVRAWSNKAPALMYSFEHLGNLSKGSHFLPGLALTQGQDDPTNGVEEQPKKKGPAHGDELAYLFEPLDDEGKPVGGAVSPSDAQTRETFVGLFAKFAHNIRQNMNSTASKNIFGFPSFSSETEQYLKIGEKITVDKDFRFCQMGLWGDMADRVTGAFCKNFLGELINLPKLIPNLPNAVPSVPGLPNLGESTDLQKLGQLGQLGQVTGQGNAQQLGQGLGQALNPGAGLTQVLSPKPTKPSPNNMWNRPFSNPFGLK
ncbi:liver carboxylesterase 1F [Aricia agestis]|uniref:liver carboxylesterase 1F n=1 Tax=Aricia agestis TaxID=91739 RepID=UPI001C202384|nr:liver carboxylesterase 1F [Aricia agestis]